MEKVDSKIFTVFSDDYGVVTSTPSMTKLPLIAIALYEQGLATFVEPDPDIDIEGKLMDLHNPGYVDSFMTGQGELAQSNGFDWSEELRDGVLSINRGQITAAGLAFEHGIAANISQGAHHASYHKGEAYCTFNSIALVAQEYPDKRIMVIDVDEHSSNGTADFARFMPNLFNYTIYGTGFGEKPHSRHIQVHLSAGEWDLYQDALNSAFTLAADSWKPNLIILNAGMDCHVDDPLNTLGLTTSQIQERDTSVFQFCKEAKIPVLFNIAGGYSHDMDFLVSLHVSTWKSAISVYRLYYPD